jgi:hypothetical protein
VSFVAAIRALMPLLAVIGLMLSPVVSPAGVAGLRVEQAAASAAPAISDDMPCCDHEKPSPPECQKLCPLAALCFASCPIGVRILDAVPNRHAYLVRVAMADEAAPERPAEAPPARPPRS